MRGLHILSAVATAALVASCSVPPLTFTGGDQIDASDTDAPVDAPGVAMLVVSTTAVTVAEAGQTTFTVKLDRAPAASVLVTLMSSDGNKVGVTPVALLFDANNFGTAQTVTVSGKEDVDVADENEMISLTSSLGNANVGVTVNDNDGLGIAVMPSSGIDVTEGGTASATVHLTAQPGGPVTVMVATDDIATATANPAMLTFNAATWNLDQTVVVSGTQDADITNDAAQLQLTGQGLADVNVPIQVNDDDVLGITPSTTNLGTVNEGANTTFTVALSQMPTGPVAVTVASSDVMLLTASPATLNFTTGNWNVPQTVTVGLPQDVDTTDETASVTLSASGLATRTVSAAIHDDDTQTILANPIPLTIVEGMTRQLDVRLAFQPAAPITLNVTSLATNVVTVSPATLTFTPANYAANQPVTVTAVEDPDAVAGMTSVRLESLADNLSTDVPVPVTDNDQLLIETSVPSVMVGEAGSVMFGVRLTAMPAATVVVNVSPSDPTAASVGPTPLSFSTANWNAFQMVTVTGVQDADLANESLTVTLAASGLPAQTVDVSVTDDDTQVVVMSSPSISVNEAGTGTIGVSLQYMPASSVTVNVMAADTSVATVAPAMLTFTTANFNTPQNVTVSGVDDPDAIDDTTMITASATGATSGNTTVTVNDNDALGIETSVTTVNIGEAGSAMVGVRLTAQPAASTTVMVVSSDPQAASVSAAMVTFTTANWNVFQNVTVAGVDDADPLNESVTLSFSSSGLITRTVNVSVTDNDPQGIVTSTNAVTVGEAGNVMFGVHLAAMPAADTTVMVMSSNITAATVTQTMLTFTPANYAANQMVQVNGVADVNLVSESVNINLSAAGMATQTVVATTTDDDTQIIVFSTASVTVGEGSSTTVGVSLMFQPTGSVTVNVASLAPAVADVSPASRSFTSGNYATPQNITISGIEDPDAANGSATIRATATGAASANLTAMVTDNDTLGLETSVPSLTIGEAGTGSFGIRLTAQPPADTTVTVMSSDAGAAVNPTTSFTFTTANWNVFQNVTVNGVDDPDPNNEGVTFTVSSSGLTSVTVSVTVTDNDPQGIIVSTTAIAFGEAGSAMFNVHLAAQPSGTVTVNVVSTDSGAAAVTNPASGALTFGAADWNLDKPVTVSGVDDLDLLNESVPINLTSTGLTTRTVTATVTDDDTQVVQVTNPLPINEGSTAVLAVTLRYAPSGAVTVTCMSNNTAVATLSTGTVNFSGADYNVAHNITVTAPQDPDAAPGMTTINCTLAGATTGTSMVNVTDDEVLAILSDQTNLAMTEGQFRTINVRLTAQPLSSTIVQVTATNPNAVTIGPTALTFTPSNWSTTQPVNISAVHDADNLGPMLDVKLESAPLATVLVHTQITDVDIPKLVLSEVVPDPNSNEYIEIWNDNGFAVDLTNYHLSDDGNYFRLPAGYTVASGDFIVKFPPGSVIGPYSSVVVAISSGSTFQSGYGMLPSYEVHASGLVPQMVFVAGNLGQASLNNIGEHIVMFYWNGQSDLVTDVDIMHGPGSGLINKTGISQDGPDADTASSVYATESCSMPATSWATGNIGIKRLAPEDGFQINTGGNGVGGDETSENTSATWSSQGQATPFAIDFPSAG